MKRSYAVGAVAAVGIVSATTWWAIRSDRADRDLTHAAATAGTESAEPARPSPRAADAGWTAAPRHLARAARAVAAPPHHIGMAPERALARYRLVNAGAPVVASLARASHEPIRVWADGRRVVKREQQVGGYAYEPRIRDPIIVTEGRRLAPPEIRLAPTARSLLALRGARGAAVRALVCVDRRGRARQVDVVDGTGLAQVDAAVVAGLGAGRYRPLRIDGERVPFCERTTVMVKP